MLLTLIGLGLMVSPVLIFISAGTVYCKQRWPDRAYDVDMVKSLLYLSLIITLTLFGHSVGGMLCT